MPPFEGDTPQDQQGTHGGHEVAQVLTRIRESNAFIDGTYEEDKTQDDTKGEETENHGDEIDASLAEEAAHGQNVNPEIGSATNEVLSGEPKEEEKQTSRFLPRKGRETLSGALDGHENFGAAMNDCFRLPCFMRMAPNGCDACVLPSPLTTRRLIMEKPMKWQNLVRHQLAQADNVDQMPAQRKSRQSAWIENQEKARKDMVPTLPTCLKLNTGDVVATQWQGKWEVGLVLSIFRILKKGNGCAQLTYGEMDRGGLHSARIALMQPDNDHEGVFSCGPRNLAVVLSMESIGRRLDGEKSKRKTTMDCTNLFLPEARWWCVLRVVGFFFGWWQNIESDLN